MKKFLDKNFLLESDLAAELYFDYAEGLPIIDYHNHLPVAQIADNSQFENLTQLWIAGDHYKWRAMRQIGLPERLISGNASDAEKFNAWAQTVPYTVRNPLFHWTHLELNRYFNINALLSPESAEGIYADVNAQLKDPSNSPRGLLSQMNVEVLCTTDDPADDLSNHCKINVEENELGVYPTFRPDALLNFSGQEFTDYLSNFSKLTETLITDWPSLIEAIKIRMQYFDDAGCRISDHGLSFMLVEQCSRIELEKITIKKIKGEKLSDKEDLAYTSALMYELGKLYHEFDWTMQLHLGPVRNVNTRLLKKLGADAGADSIGDDMQAAALATFLDRLDSTNELPRTILYNSNPSFNEVFASMAGNFAETGTKGKVQFGAAWWFMDQYEGILKQIEALSSIGLISTSVGMLTDSRSFLSFPRHEYYRRILCNVFGEDIRQGKLPHDMKWLGSIIQDICYNNPKDYLKFEPKKVHANQSVS